MPTLILVDSNQNKKIVQMSEMSEIEVSNRNFFMKSTSMIPIKEISANNHLVVIDRERYSIESIN